MKYLVLILLLTTSCGIERFTEETDTEEIINEVKEIIRVIPCELELISLKDRKGFLIERKTNTDPNGGYIWKPKTHCIPCDKAKLKEEKQVCRGYIPYEEPSEEIKNDGF